MDDTAGPGTRKQWTRRQLVKALAAAATMGVAADAVWWEPQRLVVERLTLCFPDLPPGLEGMRLAQLSDLHRSSVVEQAEIERAVAVANALAPEMVVLTGDYISRGTRYAEPCAAALAGLRAPLGRFAVLGNHDHWASAERVAGALREAGLKVLRNRSEPVRRNGADLWIVGVDDALVRQHLVAAALERVPAGAFQVALVHEPDLADEIARYPVQLQLSGHSHGGQVRIPGVGALLLPVLGRKYPMGLRRVGGLQLYTSRGVGRIRPAIRFNCPPEVTLFTLSRG